MPHNDGRRYWDSQFQFSAILPDFNEQLRWMSEHSADVEYALDLSRHYYGRQSRQWVEISSNFSADPIIPVFIHGGYWRAMRAEDHRFVLPGLKSLGTGVANIEYRLIPDVTLDEIVSDITLAINCLLERAAAGQKLLLVGHSAGAHLAMCAAKSSAIADRLAGVVAISGIYDLLPVLKCFLQAELNLSPDDINTHSVRDIAPDLQVLLVVGGDETEEFHRQSEVLSAGTGAQILRIRNAHHMNILHGLETHNTQFINAIADFLSGKTVPGDLDQRR